MVEITYSEYKKLRLSGYIPVEYIENTGNNAFIDTGVTAISSGGFFVDYQATEIRSNRIMSIAGAIRTAGSDQYCVYFKGTNGTKQYARYGTSSYDYADVTLDRSTIALIGNKLYHNGNLVNTFETDKGTCRYNMFLFRINNGGSEAYGRGFIGRIFQAKVYDTNGKLIRNYCPCRHVNGTVGMYDLMTDVFSDSPNGDEFIAGEDASFVFDGQNIDFPIYNQDGSSFQGLILRKSVSDSVVMSLGDKITGEVYYPNSSLNVTMQEYIELNGIRYVLVNPPTIVREGMASDNSQLSGMTKYSFVFYHPMYMLSNFPFTDVAVTNDQRKYLSESKTFSWIGYPDDFVAKLNKNLAGTEWIVEKSTSFPADKNTQLSEVIPFDNATIADALKTGYDTWGVPYVTGQVLPTEASYAQGKRFKIIFGLPFNEIYEDDAHEQAEIPFVFQFGHGVGLKNNSRTPRNNKIVTRIAGYGSERNIPYGYPQIQWFGDQRWDYTEYEGDTIHYDENGKVTNTPKSTAYPIYKGILGGAYVKLIKHPFTRKTLMPKVYSDTLFNKISPYLSRTIDPNEGGYTYSQELTVWLETLEVNAERTPCDAGKRAFRALEDELKSIVLVEDTSLLPLTRRFSGTDYNGAVTLYADRTVDGYINWFDDVAHEYDFESNYIGYVTYIPVSTIANPNYNPNLRLVDYYDAVPSQEYQYPNPIVTAAPSYEAHEFEDIYPELGDEEIVSAWPIDKDLEPADSWDDSIDDEGNFNQSYFKIKLPILSFDIYACASITEEMQINMRSGACIGCTFTVQVDWDDYKRNFYNSDGDFLPQGEQRDFTRYPDSSQEQIEVVVQKDNNTFGTIMPNIYQNPHAGDKFVILGISLPLSYIQNAEQRLEAEAKTYMLENNVHYFDYPLKFDEHFLSTHQHILSQLKTNSIVRFDYNGTEQELYVKQLTVKLDSAPLPQYDITLTDNVEVVLNQVGQAIDGVNKLGSLVDALRQSYEEESSSDVSRKLSRIQDDTAQGFIRFVRGLQIGEQFLSGLLGQGGVFRKEDDGTTYLEADKMYIRMKAYFDTVEIRKSLHSGGNRIASSAGAKIVRIDGLDSNGYITNVTADIVKYRCYFRGSDGDDAVTNDFIVGDLVYCHIANVASGSSLYQHHYWRLCTGKSAETNDDGEHYIDLANTTNNVTITVEEQGVEHTYTHAGMQSGSDAPMEQDDIIQLGNIYDTTRQGAIIEYVTGANAPSYQIYQGIDDYNLTSKNYVTLGYNSQTGHAEMNVYGDAYIGDRQGNAFIRFEQQNSVTHRPKLTIKAELNLESTFGGESLQQRVEEYAPAFDDSEIWAEMENLQDQIDGAIETYYMTGVPSLSLPPVISTQAHPYDDPWLDGTETQEERTRILNNHVGDLYYDKATGHGYRFIYDDINRTFLWVELTDEDVTEALRIANEAQDTADGKRTVYSAWGAWMKDGVNTLQVGDLFIPAADYTDTGVTPNVTYKANKVYKCLANATNSFHEINYTDDTAFNGYINAILNGTGATGDAATAAAAQKAIKDALGGGTVVDGGLLLTSLIAMRKYNSTTQTYKTWAGISGTYQDNETGTGYKGHGIAAWYGGAMVDHEVNTTATDFAQSLFRFDGSGYLAGGNITWDKNGIVTIANVYSDVNGSQVAWSGTTLQYMNNLSNVLPLRYVNGVAYLDPQIGFWNLSVQGSNVATQSWVNQNYISIAFFARLFQAYNGSTAINPNDTTSTIDNIKAMFGFWTERYISALGQNSSGSSGASSLSELLDVTISSPSNGQVLKYNSSTGKWYNGTDEGVTTLSWGNITNKPTTIAGYGITDAYISSGTIYLGSSSITPVTSLSGYATQSWVQNQGYVTSSGVTSITLKAGTGISLDTDNTAITSTGTRTITNAGVRAVSINGNSLRVNTNGTNADLTIPFATSSTSASYASKVVGSYTSNGGQQNPNYFGTNRVGFLMMNTTVNSNSHYKDWLIMDCYSGNDVGGGVAIGVNRQSLGAYIMRSDAARTSWAESAELCGTHNSSVSLSGSTLTVKIAGVEKSLTNTWRGIQDNLTSSSNTTESLSAKQGYLLANGSARDSTKLPLAGGTMTGSITMSQTSSARTVGIIGTYDPNKAAAIWAMGSSYQIKADGTTFGSLYGAAYAYFGSGYTFGAGYSGSHSFVWAQAGTIYAALGDYVWAKNGFKKNGSSDDYALTGNGGHLGIAESATASTIVKRSGSGYIYATYYNQSSSAETPTTDSYWFYCNSDGWLRKSSRANLESTIYPYEARLQWGGRNYSGSYGPVDAAMVPELGANRAAFLPASSVTIQYSTDGGSSWTDYGASDAQKRALFSGVGTDLAIGKNTSTGVNYTNYRLRVIINTSGYLYSVLNKFVIYISTNGSSGTWCTIDARLQSNVSSGTDTWVKFADTIGISGWSGYNVINTSGLTTYGNTAGSQYGQVRFTFGNTGYSTSYSGMRLYKIFCFGGVGWTTPSTMAKTGHLYSYNENQRAFFPEYVSASGFIKSGSDDNHALLGGGGHMAIHSGRNNEANKIVRTDGSGYIQCGYINCSSGNEGNNSSPARVWGTNGSDNYMRTYLTSALSVNYATSAGKATNDSDGNAINTTYLKKSLTSETNLYNSTSGWGWIFSNNYNSSTRATCYIAHGSSYGMHLRGYTTSSSVYLLQVYNNSAEKFSVYGDGKVYVSDKVGIGTNSPSYKLHVAGTGYFTSYVGINGAINSNYALYVNGTGYFTSQVRAKSMEFYGNSGHGGYIDFHYNNDTSVDFTTRLIEDTSGTLTCKGNYTVDGVVNTGSVYFDKTDTTGSNTSGAFRIGRFDETLGGLKMQFGGSNTKLEIINPAWTIALFAFDSSGNFTSDGTIRGKSGIYSDSYVSALGQNTSSDARKKDIIETKELSLLDIANAPSVKYLWKHNRELGMQVGSIAQYWQKILPESVHEDNDGYLSMEYGVIALLAAISTARKVQDHERRICELEKENERLRTEMEQMRLSA